MKPATGHENSFIGPLINGVISHVVLIQHFLVYTKGQVSQAIVEFEFFSRRHYQPFLKAHYIGGPTEGAKHVRMIGGPRMEGNLA